ncbi:hypothetical protein ACF0H5_014980 [Mactra antiquata]
MNFDWAITEQKSNLRPWIGENFNGYFTDIRRAARKSLPRKPDRELKGLLGLALSPRSLEGSFLSVHQSSQRDQGIIQTANRQPDFRPVIEEKEDAKTQDKEEHVATGSTETTSSTNTPKPTLITSSPILTLSSSTSRSSSTERTTINTPSVTTTLSKTSAISTKVPTSVSTDKTISTSMPSRTSDGIPTSRSSSTLTPRPLSSLTSSSSKRSSPSPSTESKLPLIEKQFTTCLSDVCLSANETLQRMNFTTSPCEDFYTFSCGEWLSHVPNARSTHNTPQSSLEEYREILLQELQDVLEGPYADGDNNFSEEVSKRLYQVCQESNRNADPTIALQELHHFVDPIGMTHDATFTKTLDDMLRACVVNFEVTPFFKMEPIPIVNQNGKLIYGIKESYNYVEALSSILFTYLSSFRQDQNTSETTMKSVPRFDELIQRTKQVFILEANLSKSLEEIELRNVSLLSTTKVLPYTSMKDLYSNIDWDSATGGIADNILVEIVNPSYFEGLDSLWVSSDVEDLKYYTFVTLLSKRIWTYMPISLRGLQANILKNGEPAYTDRDCVAHALDLANEEVHTVYVEQNTAHVLENRQVLSDLKNSVVEKFLEFVSSSTWIQSDVERVMSALARNLNVQFSPLRTNVMPTPSITARNQTFLSMALELHQQKLYRVFSVLGTEVTDVPFDWTDVRPVYNAHLNTIGFPTGLGVYMSSNIPLFELYGHIGMLISEEILNSLLGVSSASFPPQWWGTDTMIRFADDVIDCFIKQTSTSQNGIYDLENVIKSNGAFQIMNKIYLSEDTAANGVIQSTEFTQNMMFLTNIAQLHCHVDDETAEVASKAERVNSVFKNSLDFRRVFSCPDTAPMVANDVCVVFQ